MELVRKLAVVREKILDVLNGGDILFVIPPFGTMNITFVGPLILRSVAADMGYKSEVLYLNILLASVIGEDVYNGVCNAPYNMRWMKLGERLFSRSAYGMPPLGKFPESSADESVCISGHGRHHEKVTYDAKNFDLSDLLELEKTCGLFIQECVRTISSLDYKMVGCTAMVEQTNCSVALLNGIKEERPDIVTLMGGHNCEGVMAEGVASLSEKIDYVFSGESELALTEFLRGHSEGELPPQRVISADPPKDLDSLPLPDYRIFFDQTERFFGKDVSKQNVVCYETSRGCWWRKCTFCGNSTHKSVVFRRKSSEKVARELEYISENYSPSGIFMTDNIVPRSYYKNLFPMLAEKEGLLPMGWQENAVLTLEDLILLKKARVTSIVFGIESLSTGLLKLINKKNTANQNLLLLRNAQSVGIRIRWHALWGFPNDKISYYEEMLRLFPLIGHLQPPEEIVHLILVRFSSYMENPRAYGISNIRPAAIYDQIYPKWTETGALAYEFIGDYPCEAHENPEIIREIVDRITSWRSSWKKTFLLMRPFDNDFIINDGRIVGGKVKNHVLKYDAAREIMKHGLYDGSEYRKWAVAENLGVVADSFYTPLVTASPELLMRFERNNASDTY